ncbi:hypothetical protein [Nocardia crassostreae]|uniref:hypothetical protein n=1 Tax=Nocardia crassostreae TaxID=53428 RepID=UPI00082CBC5B|nr:hypothetical protein [Nocardia crassostreae]
MGDSEDAEFWGQMTPDERAGWVRQERLMYGGLIAIGTVIIQPFLTSGSLDLTAMIAVVAFAVALPHLGVMVLIEDWTMPDIYPKLRFMQQAAKSLALGGSTLGVVAAFWHISWIAGLVMLISGIGAGGALTAYQTRVMMSEQTRRETELARQQEIDKARAAADRIRRQYPDGKQRPGSRRRSTQKADLGRMRQSDPDPATQSDAGHAAERDAGPKEQGDGGDLPQV